jgi:hypothetical protein
MKYQWFRIMLPVSVLMLGACLLPSTTWADPLPGAPMGIDPFSASIDENGLATINGQFVTVNFVNGVPTVTLPEQVAAGDVILLDPAGLPGSQPVTSDILRFPDLGNGIATTMQLFSDNGDGVDNVGDLGLPSVLVSNLVTISEDPSEITLYRAQSDGGFNMYHIYSDAPLVPEPGSLSLLAAGGLPLLGFLRRRRA